MTKRKYKLLDLSTIQTRLAAFVSTRVQERKQTLQERIAFLKTIHDAHEKGMTYQEIAQEVGEGVSKQTIHRWLIEYHKTTVQNPPALKDAQAA